MLSEYEREINLSYNITIIEALWKKAHNGLGENLVSKEDRDSIYSSLEKSKETLRKMKICEINISRSAHNKWATNIENKTGISADFLMGYRRIQFGNNELDKLYDEYKDACQEIDDTLGRLGRKNMGFAKSKLEDFIKSSSQYEQDKIKKIVGKTEDDIRIINEYKSKLKKEADRLVNGGIDKIADKESYRALYYVIKGKPASYAAMTTSDDLIDLLEKISAKDMWNLGEEKLKKLCAALERDVELARAVLKIGNEIEKFK
jgi:hypothetical protein